MIENVAIGPNTFIALMTQFEALKYTTSNVHKHVIQL